jgi:succinyl-diaminopimelate desuccinylase
MKNLPDVQPKNIVDAIIAAGPISEKYAGKGETDVLLRSTINFGTFNSGAALNMMPDKAVAKGDLRFIPGLKVQQVEDLLIAAISEIEGVTWKRLNSWEPNWSDPADRIFKLCAQVAREVWNEDIAATMRVGASDSRYFREAGVPTMNCGLNGYNLGAADEYVEISDMVNVATIHTLTAYDFLAG